MIRQENYLLDTSVLIAYLRGYKETTAQVENIFKKGSSLGCCSPIVTEIFAGVRENERNKTKNLITSLKFYPITRDTAILAGEFIQYYSKKGVTLSLADASIAAVALSYKLKLFTYNKKHYPMIFPV